jgi:hypothetical protein
MADQISEIFFKPKINAVAITTPMQTRRALLTGKLRRAAIFIASVLAVIPRQWKVILAMESRMPIRGRRQHAAFTQSTQ